MLSASAAFKAAVRENPNTLSKATLRFADGTSMSLNDSKIMEESQSYKEGVSSDGAFDIGAAIIGEYSFALDNSSGAYNSKTFDGATITTYVGKKIDGTTEWLQKGIYGIEQPNTYGTVISLTGLDNMRKFEKSYSEVNTAYPATLDTILRNICTKCGVTLATTNFPNKSYVVQRRPEGELTCLQMVSYIAQIVGCWAKCDPQGRLTLNWYNKEFFDTTPTEGTYANLNLLNSMSVYTDDVVITGIRVTAQNQVATDGTKGNDGETYLYGAEGYVLDLSNNPLVLYGQAQTIATFVGQRTVGLRFRPFEVAAIGDPSIEAGDPAIITDPKGVQYKSYITTLSYKTTGFENFSCRAEYPGRNKASSFSALTEAIAQANRAVEKEKNARELAIAALEEQLEDSSGLFMTVQVQQDGSTIYYMHDKPSLAESGIVWKLTANAFGISTDGGKTYPYGLDVNGTAILNRIYAIGLDADYITTGRLEVSKDGNIRFAADYDTGQVLIQDANGNKWNTSTGELTMVGYPTDSDAVQSVTVQYAVSTSSTTAPTTGWGTSATIWEKGKYLWTRQAMTMADGTVNYSAGRLLAGDKGIGVSNAVEQYYLSTSKTELAGGSWANKQQAYAKDKYYWVRTKITWSDGSVSYDPSENGQLAQAYTSPVTELDNRLNQQDVFNRLTNGGENQGIYISNGKVYINGEYIATGVITDRAGKNYWNMDTGELQMTGYAPTTDTAKAVEIQYYVSTSSSTPTGGSWVSNATGWAKGKYLFTRNKLTMADGTTKYSEARLLSGDKGIGATAAVEEYYLSSSNSSLSGGSWSTKQQAYVKGKYYWVRTKITWSDGTTSYDPSQNGQLAQAFTSPVAELDSRLTQQEVFNRLTNNGEQQGIYISGGKVYINGQYIATGIITDRKGKNYWNMDTGAISLDTSTIVGDTTIGGLEDSLANAFGDISSLEKGSAKSVVPVYGYSNSTTKPPTNWYSGAFSLWNRKGQSCLWTKEKITLYNGKITYSSPVCLSSGDQLIRTVQEQYYMSTSKTTLRGGSWVDQQPSYINGRYIFTRTRVEYVNGVVEYKPTTNGRLAQTFTSVVDVYDSRLNQKEVFNKLTNNGKAQGLKTDDKGNLFINASYIKTGIIADAANKNYWDLRTGEFRLSSLSALEKKVTDQQIGGENIIDGTANWANWVRSSHFSFSGEVANCAASSINASTKWDKAIFSPLSNIKYEEIKDKEVTVSFEMRSTQSWGNVDDLNSVKFTIDLRDAKNKSKAMSTYMVKQQPNNSWQKVQLTFVAKPSIFNATTSTGYYVCFRVYNSSAHTLSVKRIKFEIGNVATSWSASSNDANVTAAAKANKALSDAKTDTANKIKTAKSESYNAAKKYADNISAKDQKYTRDQKKALDDSFNAAKVFNRLTNNGLSQGIYSEGVDANGNKISIKDGKYTKTPHHYNYYFNATYIRTGTLDAKVLNAGIIKPKTTSTGDYQINLGTGYIYTKNMKASNILIDGGSINIANGSYKLAFTRGRITGYSGTKAVGYIDPTAEVNLLGGRTGKVKKTVKGLQIQADGAIRISSPRLSVMNTNDVNKTTKNGFTGYVRLQKVLYSMDSQGRMGNGTIELQFINGIFVGVTQYEDSYGYGGYDRKFAFYTKQEYEDD